MKVLIVPNYSRPGAVKGANTLDAWLKSQGHEAVWTPDMTSKEYNHVTAQGCNLVVSLGGDGTLLRAARIVGYAEIPLIGFSYGHLGFLTTGRPSNLIRTVSEALEGEMHASHRATLSIEADYYFPDGTSYTERRFALNDMALTRGSLGDVISFDVGVSGNHIDQIQGDGFVVSTATGSTGYALAAGGPIVTPEFNGMVCVPIAPHTILARAFLTSESEIVEIDMSQERPVERTVLADGQPMGQRGGRAMHIRVRRGPGDIILLDRSSQSFYESVSRVFYGKVATDDR
ncbi:MAG: NAD(+)/NADH kinase [Coriobacteriaceae bacterium]|uniref:NAD(+)/NADH kinase n=1 Tax=Atopobium sp. oral taxon 416 TaxID=712157 RepID=UPI000FF7AC29|nr:NAD(+)/NADH kinase [Atopobium sp. oral taxon 416]QUC04599.1 NAD(+)/NADH kinase [Atopobium sp. oral taxon 416]RRF99958.1 MAG: NAD(+)/NADH kinase [Coriobacteriaceae bacterium]